MVSKWNNYNDIKKGDLVTSYWEGYFRVIQVDRRYYEAGKIASWEIEKGIVAGDEKVPIIHLYSVTDKSGNPRKRKNKIRNCDASYCKKIDFKSNEDLRDQTIKDAKEKYKNLNKAIQGFPWE